MQAVPLLTDRTTLIRNRARASDTFLRDIASDELLDRLSLVNRQFKDPVLIGPANELIPNALHIDDDETLAITPAHHDLAIHFMALHWANDPLGQIIQSAKI